MRPDTPHTGGTILRIKVVDGRVVGEMVHRKESGEELVLRCDYLKITPHGMTWGRLNDKRPRGVMLFEGQARRRHTFWEGPICQYQVG